jgi:hypothetical protein
MSWKPLDFSIEEYNKILFNLGILDDEEDWELYQLQEARYAEVLDTLENIDLTLS